MATVRFLADWREEQVGDIKAGGRLLIEYGPERAAQCFEGYDGSPAASVIVEARFQPGGQHVDGGAPLEVEVPGDANEVEIWARCSDRSGSSAFDSRFGKNYRFPVVSETRRSRRTRPATK